MPKIEWFFDYACPFCLRGHEYLLEIAPKYPDVEIVWCPCEAHPRPEPGPHSDLLSQSMYFALKNGVDIWTYHKRMYKAGLTDRSKLVDIDDIDSVCSYVSDLLDANALKKALENGEFAEVHKQCNIHAYEECGVWAVPSCRAENLKLDSVEGVGITPKQLDDFFAAAR